MGGGFQDFFASFGVGIALCTILVSGSKAITDYYFPFIILLLVSIFLFLFLLRCILLPYISQAPMKKNLSETFSGKRSRRRAIPSLKTIRSDISRRNLTWGNRKSGVNSCGVDRKFLSIRRGTFQRQRSRSETDITAIFPNAPRGLQETHSFHQRPTQEDDLLSETNRNLSCSETECNSMSSPFMNRKGKKNLRSAVKKMTAFL